MKLDRTGIANTCPSIDYVIAFIQNCSKEFGKDENFQHFDCLDVLTTLEQIRTDNENLRTFGLFTLETLDDVENQLYNRDIEYYELQNKYENLLNK